MKKNLKVLLACALLPAFAFIGKNTSGNDKIKVVIDAGHGGIDFGAQHEGINEKDIVSAIAEKMRALNNDSEVELYLTREDDQLVKLQDRTQKINDLNADLVISLHVNASAKPENSGTELFIASKSDFKDESRKIAELLSSKFETELARTTKETQEAPFYILKNSNAPSIVVELGYVTNSNDFVFLTDENSQQRIARTLLDFAKELPN